MRNRNQPPLAEFIKLAARRDGLAASHYTSNDCRVLVKISHVLLAISSNEAGNNKIASVFTGYSAEIFDFEPVRMK
ncbi:hypothetical protein [Paenibacillus cymbidii]|uniref:hypothetical protein n=1 Tax=Paenibacillus cymbidii TaxID=1639034 RepID=UPI0010812F97|nr:hypothetical protein [Paenibacillus cymbidii]